jgi:hypothetical protein
MLYIKSVIIFHINRKIDVKKFIEFLNYINKKIDKLSLIRTKVNSKSIIIILY